MACFSDVKLALPVSIYQKMFGESQSHKDSSYILDLLNKAEASYVPNCDAVILYWESFEWNISNPGISFITDFINNLKETDYNIIILSEELEDVQTKGKMEEPFFCIVREIISSEDDTAIPVNSLTLKQISRPKRKSGLWVA